MNTLQADQPNRERRPIAGVRLLLLALPCAWAFMLNDITSIEAGRLSVVGLPADATLLSLTPIPLLILWLVCFQYWITTRRSVSNWVVRLVALWLISIAMVGGVWQFAFRNTATMRISQMPESDAIQEVERKTGLKLSWMSRGNDCSVLFDKRTPAAQNQLQNALVDWKPKIAR